VMYGVLRGAQTAADWTLPHNLRDVAIDASLGPILGVAGRPIARAVRGLGRGAWNASAPFRRGLGEAGQRAWRYLNPPHDPRKRRTIERLGGKDALKAAREREILGGRPVDDPDYYDERLPEVEWDIERMQKPRLAREEDRAFEAEFGLPSRGRLERLSSIDTRPGRGQDYERWAEAQGHHDAVMYGDNQLAKLRYLEQLRDRELAARKLYARRSGDHPGTGAEHVESYQRNKAPAGGNPTEMWPHGVARRPITDDSILGKMGLEAADTRKRVGDVPLQRPRAFEKAEEMLRRRMGTESRNPAAELIKYGAREIAEANAAEARRLGKTYVESQGVSPEAADKIVGTLERILRGRTGATRRSQD